MSDAPRCATWRKASVVFARGAFVALAVGVLAGSVGVMHYIPAAATTLQAHGIQFAGLRSLHTVFITAWIFLAGVSIVHRWMDDQDVPATWGDRMRLRATVALWAVAGLGSLVTLPLGITSGREYVDFHPVLAVPVLLGWILFGWSFYRVAAKGFWSRPVHVTMWGVAVPFFAFTFVEQFAWLIPDVFEQPVVDLRIQWKACGTLVGSFNLIVYGCILYVAEKLSGNTAYAQSRTAYALFGVGLLNSFTNFGHHTYHLPQSAAVNWISFVVSMTEILILARVAWDVVAIASVGAARDDARRFLCASKWWSTAMLLTAILISVPPLNALIHGTHVVTAHAMGTEIGIDSMILLGALAWALGTREVSPVGAWSAALNVSAAALVTWLHVSGLVVGLARYRGLPAPEWLVVSNPVLFAVAGFATAACLFGVTWRFVPALWRTADARTAAVPQRAA
jgi:nitric oxide reductase subunit B